MIGEYCEKYLGYRHLSGAKAYCGEDVGTHIIYCERCKKKNVNAKGLGGEQKC